MKSKQGPARGGAQRPAGKRPARGHAAAKPGAHGKHAAAKAGAHGKHTAAKAGAQGKVQARERREGKKHERDRGRGARDAAAGPRAMKPGLGKTARVHPSPGSAPGARPSPHAPKQAAEEAKPAPRAAYPQVPQAVSRLSGEPHPGQWILTTREGSEQDLVDELMLGKVIDPAPCVLAPGLVLSPKVPKREKRYVELTFARQGFEILISVRTHDMEQMISRIERSLRHKLERASVYALHVWVADTRASNPLSGMADELEARLAARLAESLPAAKRVDDASLRRLGSIPFAQVCLIDTERAVAGVMHSNATPSLARGGRTRVRVTGELPSRAARKLEEALAWLGVEPSAGDVCVDLGAAPGGWTYVLANRKARVIAVDPAKLRPDIAAMKGVRHVQESAFTFTPDEPIDWLFCDMAWRPLEAAALLAKWGRRRWARMLVANIKLPMKKKAEILARVRRILEDEGEWKGLRTKQLYHDRDEITLTAHTG